MQKGTLKKIALDINLDFGERLNAGEIRIYVAKHYKLQHLQLQSVTAERNVCSIGYAEPIFFYRPIVMLGMALECRDWGAELMDVSIWMIEAKK